MTTGEWKPELDIVRQNGELEFPQSVGLRFIYWTHMPSNVPDLLPHLEGVDAIALESVASAPTGDPETDKASASYIPGLFLLLNKVTLGEADERIREVISDHADKLDWCALAMKLENSGIELLPVDEFERGPAGNISVSHDLSLRQAKLDEITRRESLVIKQLYAIAERLAQGGEPKTLAVIYGANHGLLSIGAKRLGAPMERIWVHPQLSYSPFGPGPYDIAERLVRWGKYDSLGSLPSKDQDILNLGDQITFHAPATASSAAFMVKALARIYERPEDWAQLTSQVHLATKLLAKSQSRLQIPIAARTNKVKLAHIRENLRQKFGASAEELARSNHFSIYGGHSNE